MNAPQSVTRIIRILETLCTAEGPMSLAEMSRVLGLPKTSLAALLRGLVDEDVLLAADGVYRLGPSAFSLGSDLMIARRRLQSSDLVSEGMKRLAERSGETILFAVADADGTSMTYVQTVESRNVLRFAVSPGDRRFLHNTAGGRMLLAVQNDAAIARYFAQLRLIGDAGGGKEEKARIKAALQQAREENVAQTIDEHADGVTGSAALIRNADGMIVGALIVAAPSSRSQDKLAELKDMVREEALAISRTLGLQTR